MVLRPRNIKGKIENSEESSHENNSDYSNDSSNYKDSRNCQESNSGRFIKFTLLVILQAMALGLFFYLGSLKKDKEVAVEVGKKNKYNLEIHWAGGPVTLTQDGDIDKDACIILSECFKSKYFAPDPVKYPDNPFQLCHKNLRNILRAFDSGFYFDGPRLVGFISSDFDNSSNFSQISLYNICVRKEDRGKGIAKALVPEYVKALVAKRTPPHIPRIYVGLDVDFTTETDVSAFALYAKMGFNRWWEPCHSISNFDYNIMDRQFFKSNPTLEPNEHESQDPPPPAYIFPMSQFILSRKEALRDQLYDRRGKLFTHFCMVMLLNSDDFGSVGSDIKAAVQAGLKNPKN